jgi:RNA recognition motif-containing protein
MKCQPNQPLLLFSAIKFGNLLETRGAITVLYEMLSFLCLRGFELLTDLLHGFGFVAMEDSAANAAIKALNDTELDGRTLRVIEARPREDLSNGGHRNSKYPHSGGGRY